MSWIGSIDYGQAEGRLRKIYDRIVGPGGELDNILKVHGHRPHTLEGHMALYKSVLHHSGNALPKWFLETLGVYVSQLNRCEYCVQHHFAGLSRLLGDDERACSVRAALDSGVFDSVFDDRQQCALRYARRLTLEPGNLRETEVASLVDAGYSDGEILEINQVVSYFNYANRTVLGLGVSLEGDALGLSPGDTANDENWHHR